MRSPSFIVFNMVIIGFNVFNLQAALALWVNLWGPHNEPPRGAWALGWESLVQNSRWVWKLRGTWGFLIRTILEAFFFFFTYYLFSFKKCVCVCVYIKWLSIAQKVCTRHVNLVHAVFKCQDWIIVPQVCLRSLNLSWWLWLRKLRPSLGSIATFWWQVWGRSACSHLPLAQIW